jgi:hypothetical protein
MLQQERKLDVITHYSLICESCDINHIEKTNDVHERLVKTRETVRLPRVIME